MDDTLRRVAKAKPAPAGRRAEFEIGDLAADATLEAEAASEEPAQESAPEPVERNASDTAAVAEAVDVDATKAKAEADAFRRRRHAHRLRAR